MLTVTSPSQLGVWHANVMPPWNGRTFEAHTSAPASRAASVQPNVTTRSQWRACSSTVSSSSVSRFTTAVRAWSKMRSLLPK